MKKIGLFYSYNTKKTAQAAKKIAEILGEKVVDQINAEETTESLFKKYDNLILGVPTWFDGELPNYWDEFIPELMDINLKGKRIAIFGAGNQLGYPENFVDGIGIMADILEKQNAKIVGFTSTEGYTFESSKAKRGEKFAGLALDFENQAAKNKERIAKWCEQLMKEFNN
jgi:flavodoxin I